MSDQQLITGVALTIVTTYMTFSELNESFSVYSFQVATRLGYCSCIVHLCTISLLWEHFDANKRLRDFRVVLVSVFLALLALCMVISNSDAFIFNSHISVQCAIENFKLVDTKRPHYLKIVDEMMLASNLISTIFVPLLRYSGRLFELYHPLARHDPQYLYLWSLRLVFGRGGEEYYQALQKKYQAELEAVRKKRHRSGLRSLGLMEWEFIFGIWFTSLYTSFLWDLILLTSYFAIGIIGLLIFYMDAQVDHVKMKPNFGQLLPLLLLGLPFLVAWETYLSTATPPHSQLQHVWR
ncbi:hypothetical protein ColKHC_05254 [Colletotrichum higginsianum]|nr:hypothetical protein ColKHC_05254 [Colletotrichum higginsianum]